MGVWSTLLKYGGKAAKGVGTATAATGKSMGKAVLHPSQTLRGAGQAVKTATIGGAVGYVGWEKLTTDKSVVRIVSDAVVGESVTDTIAGTADGVRELTGKAGEAVSSVSGAVTGIDNKLNGVSNFLRQASGGGGLDTVSYTHLLPFPTLERFGLTREMIEDLPMRVLDDICDGRHSPVLPVRVTDEHGGQIESRSRFAFIRMDNGQVDVVFYPALKSSPLERYDEAQQKQLLDGKAIVADVEMADGRSSKAFVQIDTETKQVMYVPTPIIARNLDVYKRQIFGRG